MERAYFRLSREVREWAAGVRGRKEASEIKTGPDGATKALIYSTTDGVHVYFTCVSSLGSMVSAVDVDPEDVLQLYERSVLQMLRQAVPTLSWLASLGVDPHSAADAATVLDVMES